MKWSFLQYNYSYHTILQTCWELSDQNIFPLKSRYFSGFYCIGTSSCPKQRTETCTNYRNKNMFLLPVRRVSNCHHALHFIKLAGRLVELKYGLGYKPSTDQA